MDYQPISPIALRLINKVVRTIERVWMGFAMVVELQNHLLATVHNRIERTRHT
jgi:hypothetical protein